MSGCNKGEQCHLAHQGGSQSVVSWGHQVLYLCFAQSFVVTLGEPLTCTQSVKLKKLFQTHFHHVDSYHECNLQHHIQYYELLFLRTSAGNSSIRPVCYRHGDWFFNVWRYGDLMYPFSAKGEAVLSVLPKDGLPSVTLLIAPSRANMRRCSLLPVGNGQFSILGHLG